MRARARSGTVLQVMRNIILDYRLLFLHLLKLKLPCKVSSVLGSRDLFPHQVTYQHNQIQQCLGNLCASKLVSGEALSIGGRQGHYPSGGGVLGQRNPQFICFQIYVKSYVNFTFQHRKHSEHMTYISLIWKATPSTLSTALISAEVMSFESSRP